MRKAIPCAVGGLTAVLVVVLIWSLPTVRRPPVVSLVGMEPAGIFDDAGVEMWLVTLSLSNSYPPTSGYQNYLYVKNNARGIEARVGNRLIAVKGMLDCGLGPGQRVERMLLMPERVDACRIFLKCVGPPFVGGRLAWVAGRLPQFVRSRLPFRFWRWVDSISYGPGSDWRENSIELPLPSESPRVVISSPTDG